MTLNFTTAVLMAILGPVTTLTSLWLRLAWRTRHEQARRRTLVDLVKALRQGCELEEHGPDGTQLRIIIRAGDVPDDARDPTERLPQR